MTGTHMSQWPATPYPGRRPDTSVLVDVDGQVRVLRPDPDAPSGWRVRHGEGFVDLDRHLERLGAAPLEDRAALLSYGSNASPGKVAQMSRPQDAGFPLPAVLLRAEVRGLAAAWTTGRRARDGAVPATLVAEPDEVGAGTTMAVLMVGPGQWEALDRVEGRIPGGTSRYRLMRLTAGDVLLEDGSRPAPLWAYVGSAEGRRPAVGPGGRVLLLAEVPAPTSSDPVAGGPADWGALGTWEPDHFHPGPAGHTIRYADRVARSGGVSGAEPGTRSG